MTTEVQSHAQALADEIAQLQIELPKLTAQRQELAQFPSLPPDANPAEVAQRIAASVTDNAGKIRGLDAAIANLQSTLASKRLQLAQAKETERRADLSYRMGLLHEDATRSCEKINQISALLEAEISRLRAIEQAVHPIRYALQSYRPYPYVYSDETLTVIEASTTEVGHHLLARPLRSV